MLMLELRRINSQQSHGGICVRVALVTGTRPQIIKSAPVLRALEKKSIDCEFIHTGQHYDYELAGAFIDEFKLKPPTDLDVGSGDYCIQMSSIMERLNSHLKENPPDYMIVPGDTTSALGAAMVGFKMEVPVCHLEAGLRRYDFTYQEEMNRRLIDHGAAGLFAPTQTAVDNLKLEDVLGKIYLIGDTMYDILKDRLPKYSDTKFKDKVLKDLKLDLGEFALLTLHRRENVDSPELLTVIVNAINDLDFPVIFPMHPRTRKQLQEFSLKLDESHVHVVEPQAYDEFMSLIASAKLVISDSGGIQKECYLLNVPLVSLHQRTEWVETFKAGANRLTPIVKDQIVTNCQEMFGKTLSNDPSVYGDGKAASKIPPILESGEIISPTDRTRDPFADYF